MKETALTNIKVALVGNPNVGKSSLFNELTGLRQKVGNFPGVTVEKKEGKLSIHASLTASVTDLPGIYNLTAESEDEQIATRYLENGSTDLIIVVADATNLRRNLLLCAQVIRFGKPVILALNMMDLAERNKLNIDIPLLSKLLGVPVVPINARIGKGIEQLKEAIADVSSKGLRPIPPVLLTTDPTDTIGLYREISSIIDRCLSEGNQEPESLRISRKIDNLLIHPIFGYLIFVAILFLVFQAIFSWSAYPMKLIDTGFLALGGWVHQLLPPGLFNDLLVNGVIPGLGGIVIFVPQIAFLFIFLSILEDTGYLSRISFLLDKSLRRFGLNGKSVIPLLSGTACAVPAIMSARSIPNPKERLITIFITPLMSCSARIPVYTLLIALLTPEDARIGIFNLQGILMLALYLIGAVAAILSGFVLNLLIKSPVNPAFIFEVPIYRAPRWKSIANTVYMKVKSFILEAGKIIIAISIVLWALSSFGPGISENSEQHSFTKIEKTEQLENSYAGHLGKTIEPVIKPLGFDWKIGISLITSFAAREVFVGTMATIYAVETEGNEVPIREKMQQATWPGTGEKIYTTATVCSLLIFYAFALQCMSTIAVVKKETNGWKWPIIQLIYLSSLAYLSSFVVYNLLSAW